MPSATFAGRHIVVTGGTGALGTAVAARLIAGGATCHIPNYAEGERAGFALAGEDRVAVTPGVDLTDEDAVARFYAALPGLWASVHIAGGFDMGPAVATSKAAFQTQMDMNALTAFLCCREAAKKMQAGKAGGRLLNVAARPGVEPRTGAGMAAYTASKAAVAALTQALGEELVGDDILVNAIAPSVLDTPGNRAAMPDADPAKWAALDAVAETIAFLVSPENTVTRGAVVPVYGKT